MPAALEIEMQGQIRAEAKALQDVFLKTLGWKGVRKLEQFAVVNAARAYAPYVRAAAPKDVGGLAKSVRGRRSRYQRPGAIVGPTQGKKQAWYARFVIYGSKPHTIPKTNVVGQAINRRLDAAGAGYSVFDQGKIQHPGARGNNFVFPAVEANYQKGADAFGATVVLLLNDEAKRAKVLGLEIEYANGTAAKWQSHPALKHWNKPDYVGPLTPLQAFGRSKREASDKVKAIAASARVQQLRQDARVFGIRPNMSNLRAG
jgi:hypothetical protein